MTFCQPTYSSPVCSPQKGGQRGRDQEAESSAAMLEDQSMMEEELMEEDSMMESRSERGTVVSDTVDEMYLFRW